MFHGNFIYYILRALGIYFCIYFHQTSLCASLHVRSARASDLLMVEMDTQKLLCSVLCCFCFLFSILSGRQQAVQGHHHVPSNIRPLKLFVFGDSYADTGNTNKSQSAWKYPYGITFPGKPAGRFSDGRVLTDYVAKFLGLKSPIPYEGWKSSSRGIPLLKYGMNFAYGGTGVFVTVFPSPKMTVQIDILEHLLKDNVFTAKDLESSVSLVSLAGKDYLAYIGTNGSSEGLQSFITTVVNQLAINLKRIHGLGVKKIAVTGIVPFGCLPIFTGTSSFQQNIYRSIKFENPLKPCCLGTTVSGEYFTISGEYFTCGRVDENGAKRYTLCENPKSGFFWDLAHPSQEGWRAVYSALQATLEQYFLH
ncbi:hypothetical protein CIPAW_10G007700 [Carya illinoinensis]|uniref:GDSL esterase/lipase n=1 Tax=Carya illinoinensis TaxID=32201 RepID=A0A8T1P8J8_CARIL|nr:hypothetical protein CIPAW_10G007700 [Carya illinoinensis]